uniref:Uncharacterized protein n=1 Tax=Cladonia uncialis subsp. uncialis TaxID=180999 RepID=A0A2K9YDG8_CLAUC|nr:hypothetical protein [Cladonia uncialis subsp. uncialis]
MDSKVNLGRNAVVARGTQISGKKVSVAQWQRVDAKYMSVAKWKDNLGVKGLKLVPFYGTQTVQAAPRDENPSEDYWEPWDREVNKVEDDYEDEDKDKG